MALWIDGSSLQQTACVDRRMSCSLACFAKLAKLQFACLQSDKVVKRLCRRDAIVFAASGCKSFTSHGNRVISRRIGSCPGFFVANGLVPGSALFPGSCCCLLLG